VFWRTSTIRVRRANGALIQSTLVGRGQLSLEMQFRSAHRHFMKAIIPFIPLTADLKNGHEESVN